MARSRLLKPGFFKNEDLALLEPHARLCFAGLWLLADREGRLEDRPLRIKAEIFPYENIDVNAVLDRLSQTGFISRYRCDNKPFIAVLKFNQHQSPHVRETPSTIPAPDSPDARIGLALAVDSPRTPCIVSVSDPVSIPVPVPVPRTGQSQAESPSKTTNGSGHRAHTSSLETDDISERAGRLVERFGDAYTEKLNGARYRQRPNLDWVEACELCKLWDDTRLDKLVLCFLATDDPWICGTDKGFQIFAKKASWVDQRLAAWEAERRTAVS